MGEMNDRIPYQAITLVKEFLKNNHDLAVLDLGCGEGDFLFGLINDEELTFQLIHAVDNMKEDYRFNLGLDLNIIYRSRFPDIKREPKIDFKVKDLCEFIDETSDKYRQPLLTNYLNSGIFILYDPLQSTVCNLSFCKVLFGHFRIQCLLLIYFVSLSTIFVGNLTYFSCRQTYPIFFTQISCPVQIISQIHHSYFHFGPLQPFCK